MKKVLTTYSRDDVQRIIDQIPYTGATFTNSLQRGTYTEHFWIRAGGTATEAARVTSKKDETGRNVFTVRLPAEDRRHGK